MRRLPNTELRIPHKIVKVPDASTFPTDTRPPDRLGRFLGAQKSDRLSPMILVDGQENLIIPAWRTALPMLAATVGLQCANTSDRRIVAPCRAMSTPRLRSRKVWPTDSTSVKSRRTRLEAFNARAIWSWTCCA